MPAGDAGAIGGAGGAANLRGFEAQFRAERPGLRRVGYRNCDGYAMELLVPRQVARDPRGQAIWWHITPYLPGRHGSYRLAVPEDSGMAGWRLQRHAGTGWQDLPRPAAHRGDAPRQAVLSPAEIGASLPVRLDLAEAIGLAPGPLSPGRYRLQAGEFTVATASGGRCSMRPFWDFDIQ